MKKALLIFFIVSIGISLQNLQAQSFPEMDASPMDLVMARPDKKSPPFARVIYSRPQKRDVLFMEILCLTEKFGVLVPTKLQNLMFTYQ